jgi:hypothetical protein
MPPTRAGIDEKPPAQLGCFRIQKNCRIRRNACAFEELCEIPNAKCNFLFILKSNPLRYPILIRYFPVDAPDNFDHN